MSKQIAAILDRDERFALRLAEYMNRRTNLPVRAVPFSDPQMLEGFARKHPVRILVVHESLAKAREALAGLCPVCLVLTENREEKEGSGCLYRYQPADRLIGRILQYAGEAGEETARKTLLLGVCSPVGRCGKTSLAVALGLALAARRQTLYVNLESVSGFPELGRCPAGGQNTSDLLYCLRTAQEDFPRRLEECTQRWRELAYLVPGLTAADLGRTGGGEWLQLIERAAGCGGYEAAVLDIGLEIKDFPALLLACRRIYVPTLPDAVSDAKVRRFIREITSEGAENRIDSRNLLVLTVPREAEPGAGVFPEQLGRGDIAALAGRLVAKSESW